MNHQTSLPSFRILFGALAVLVLASNQNSSPWAASAFSRSGMIQKRRAAYSCAAPLRVSTSSRPTTGIVEDDEARTIFTKAHDFAFSDDKTVQGSSSLTDEEALLGESRYWLREMIRVQSGCAAGTVSDKNVCENQLEAAEIVGRLRRRIETHETKLAKRSKGSDSAVPMIATELSVGALLVVVAIFWSTLDLGQHHGDIPSIDNYQQWMAVVKEKEYLLFGMFWQ